MTSQKLGEEEKEEEEEEEEEEEGEREAFCNFCKRRSDSTVSKPRT